MPAQRPNLAAALIPFLRKDLHALSARDSHRAIAGDDPHPSPSILVNTSDEGGRLMPTGNAHEPRGISLS
jgi:hypothetical protein